MTTSSFTQDKPHRDLARAGQPVPPNWRQLFLEHYAELGVRWKAAKLAGISHDTVLNHEHADHAFAQQIEDARQEFADSREENLRKLGDNGNVVGDIVLLKKHRPNDFLERRLEMSVSLSATVDPAEVRGLLAAMLQTATPSTQRLITGGDMVSAALATERLALGQHDPDNGVLGEGQETETTRARAGVQCDSASSLAPDAELGA